MHFCLFQTNEWFTHDIANSEEVYLSHAASITHVSPLNPHVS